MAVSIHGNDHLFELNVVHDVCTASDDAGALYKGRNPSCRGNVIRYNFWHDIGSPMGHGTAAVYFDDGDGGDTVFGNIFLRCGHPGRGSFGTVFSHGGHDNVAENNIFIECQRALGSAPWNDERWKQAVEGGAGCDWQERLLEEVDITKPPYTTRYPGLVGFMDPQPGQVRVNRARNNVLVRCGQTSSGNWKYAPEEIWATDADPGFVDADGQLPTPSRRRGFPASAGLPSHPVRPDGTESGTEYRLPQRRLNSTCSKPPTRHYVRKPYHALDHPAVLATAYRKPGKTLVAIASWAREKVTCHLTIDFAKRVWTPLMRGCTP